MKIAVLISTMAAGYILQCAPGDAKAQVEFQLYTVRAVVTNLL